MQLEKNKIKCKHNKNRIKTTIKKIQKVKKRTQQFNNYQTMTEKHTFKKEKKYICIINSFLSKSGKPSEFIKA